jgi:hypothetical protein
MYEKVLFRSQGPLSSKYLPWKIGTMDIHLKKGQVSLGASEETEQGILYAMIADMTFHVSDSSPKIGETTENKWQMTRKEAPVTD